MSTKDIIKMVGSSLTLPLPIINDCNVRYISGATLIE